MRNKKLLSVVLSVLMTLSFLFQGGVVAPSYAGEVGNNIITNASISKIDGSPITGTIAAWQAFRINVDYKLPNNIVHEGDTSTITLPAGIVSASPSTFQIKYGSNIVANGKLVDGNPTKVILTYTKYVEGKSDLEGKFFINAQIDNKVHNTEKTISVDLSNNGETVHAGNLNYKPKIINLLPILKAGWMWSQDSTVGIYQIKINQKNEALVNAKVVDELLDSTASYLPDKMTIYEGKWESTYGGTGLELKDKKDVTNQYKDKITYNGSKFTLDIGSSPEGKGLLIEYRVKIPYKPVAGEKFKNKATFTNNNKEYSHGVTYQIMEAGGSGEGYTYSLEINKKDPSGNSLQGAKFDIIRVRSGQVVGKVETDANGYAKMSGLLHDDYLIHETDAPKGYGLAEDMNVAATDFDSTTKTVKKTIIDKKESISIPVTKKWIGPEGTSATIRLFAGNDEVGSVTLNKANNWKHTFANLEKYKDGKEIKYTVKEDSIANYNTKITGDMASGFTVTNTNVEKTKVNVTKKWVGKEKDSVKVKLIADGTEKQETTLSAATNWKHEFDNLAKYDEADGHKIAYTIKEVSIDGYKSVISGSAEDGFTITNTITGKVSIPVTKKWVGPEGTSATIRLFADNSEVGSVTLNKANNWKHTFAGLEKYKDGNEIVYTIKEDAIANYKSEISGYAASGFTVKNTNTEKVTVLVEKKWVGKSSNKVEVKLLADGTEKESADLTAADSWKHEFKNLPKYDSADGHEIVYTVKEVKISGYNTVISGTAKDGFTITNTITGKVSIPVTKKWVGPEGTSATIRLFADNSEVGSVTLNKANNWKHTFANLEKYKDGKEIKYTVKEDAIANYKSEISGDAASGFTVKNTNTEKVTVPVEKKWVGKSANKVEVKLLADGTEKESADLTAADSWKHEFKNLPKYDSADGHEIVYTVKEVKIFGYNTVISGTAKDGFTITNTITGKVSIPVTKKWVGPEGTSATIRLFADNSEVGSVTLNKANNWKHTFAGLEKYKDGNEIVYTVKEDAIANYKSVVSGDMTSGYTITNTNVEKLSIPVTKKWVGKAGDSATVKLLADGSVKETITLNAAGNWNHTFVNLPKYDANDGHEIVYTLDETKVNGYTTGISGTAMTGFTITNTITGKVSIPVTKKWIGKPVSSAKIELYADGVKKDSITLNEENHWQHTFTNLDKYKNGAEIKYTVKEDAIANYNTKITGDMASGFTVTNTNVEKTKVNVTKKWVGKAKGSVKVKLIADGTEKQEATLSAATNWKHEFDNLAKYDEADGHKITYTIKEVSIDGYKSVISGSAEDGFTITNTEENPKIANKPKSPNTGDSSNVTLYGYILVSSILALLVLIAIRKKHI